METRYVGEAIHKKMRGVTHPMTPRGTADSMVAFQTVAEFVSAIAPSRTIRRRFLLVLHFLYPIAVPIVQYALNASKKASVAQILYIFLYNTVRITPH
jgi:hypothetical protein